MLKRDEIRGNRGGGGGDLARGVQCGIVKRARFDTIQFIRLVHRLDESVARERVAYSD